MILRSKGVIALLLACVALPAAARNLTVEQKLADFHYFLSVINSGYGPRDYKAANEGMSYPQLNTQFESEITNTKDNTEFYYKMVEYVAAYHDGHFNLRLPTTRMATLPIVTDLVEGKVLISQINRDKLKEDKFPFAVGDEVVSVDGQPASQFVDSISKYIASGKSNSIRRFASWLVFNRNSQKIPLPTSKTIKLEIRRGTSAVIEPVELEWNFKGEDLDESNVSAVKPMTLSSRISNIDYDRLDNLALQEYVHPDADLNYACSGSTRIAIPKNATVIMKTPFVAYYHPTAKGNVGYLRIPHYAPPAGPGENQTEATLAWINQYQFAIRELEKNTVGLIIDQDHNCGGSVWVVHQIIAMFMSEPFQPSQFELLASKESYLEFKKWANEVPDHTVERENINRVVKAVEDAWVKGTSYLTPKISIDGEQLVRNNPIHYTKPIVMLIDEISGSGGDMFPAMMKGLGRAKLFGQSTSGLGGHVENYPVGLPNSQLTFRITKSLFYRPDGVAIENNGAVADREYTITRDDMLYGFKGYQQEYLNYLLGMLP